MLPIFVDESGSVSAGAMIMAGVAIDADAAVALLRRFRVVTGLNGELKGSRIALIERAFFFELFERFGGRAKVCVAPRQGSDRQAADFDVYVALLTQLVDDWLAEEPDCPRILIDTGRYDAMALENVRLDVARMLASCGTAQMVDSRRSAGIQIADVVANSIFNLEVGSNRSNRIRTILDPFLESGVIKTSRLRLYPARKQERPAVDPIARRSHSSMSGKTQPS